MREPDLTTTRPSESATYRNRDRDVDWSDGTCLHQ